MIVCVSGFVVLSLLQAITKVILLILHDTDLFCYHYHSVSQSLRQQKTHSPKLISQAVYQLVNHPGIHSVGHEVPSISRDHTKLATFQSWLYCKMFSCDFRTFAPLLKYPIMQVWK